MASLRLVARFAAIALAFVALGSAARAADFPLLKGPPVYAPPVFTWTGFYVGVNAGVSAGGWSRAQEIDPLALISIPRWESAQAAGFSGGGQIGYNYQFANRIVAGVEADLQGTTLHGTYENYNECDFLGCSHGQDEQKVDWWGTVRGRLGYAFGNLLPYATAGFAYGEVTNGCDYSTIAVLTCYAGNPYSWSSVRPGWTAGAGLEYALTGNLTLKAEYLYTDLGTWTSQDPNDAVEHPGQYLIYTRTAFNTVRVGLNWQFDGQAPSSGFMALASSDPPSVVAAPVVTWTGIYVGANAGLSLGGFSRVSNQVILGIDPAYWASTQGAGFSGGGGFGYNNQFANNIVAGIETDLQGSTLDGSYENYKECSGSACMYDQDTQKVDWWGTVRGRVGYALGDLLPYATAGFAYGEVTNGCNVDLLVVGCYSGNAYSWSSLRPGWTAGAGLEYALTKNLSVKAEYLYTDLGTWVSQDPYDAIHNPGQYFIYTRTTFNTVRFGANWKFD